MRTNRQPDVPAAVTLWQSGTVGERQILLHATASRSLTRQLQQMIESGRDVLCARRSFQQLPQYMQAAVRKHYQQTEAVWDTMSAFDALELLQLACALDSSPSVHYLAHHGHEVQLCTSAFCELPVRVQVLLCIGHTTQGTIGAAPWYAVLS